jgi:hypothetical protein
VLNFQWPLSLVYYVHFAKMLFLAFNGRKAAYLGIPDISLRQRQVDACHA